MRYKIKRLTKFEIEVLVDSLEMQIDRCNEFLDCWSYKGNEKCEDVLNEKKLKKTSEKLQDHLCKIRGYK